MGLVFNPNDKNMVIVFKDLLSVFMPGDKPKPEFYRESLFCVKKGEKQVGTKKI